MTANFSNDMYQQLFEQVNHRIVMFEPHLEYPLSRILGDGYWGDDQTFHRAVGLLFGQLAKDGLVPFQRTGTTPFGPALYTYIP